MLSPRSPPSSLSRPCCGRSKPATRRSRDDLPAPLGPTTSNASPAPTVKPTPLKTCRPPRTQVRSDPTSRIMERTPGGRRLLARQPEKTLIPCACRWRASIFWNGAKKDPISPSSRAPYQPALDSRPVTGGASGSLLPSSRFSPGWMGPDHDDVNRQLSLLQTPEGGQQDICLLQPGDR